MKSDAKHSGILFISIALSLTVFLAGCGGPVVFLDRTYDFYYIETVGVIPFENLSQSQGAGKQATLIFLTELLASETYDLTEPGETAKALSEFNLTRTGTLDITQIKQLGERLGVQALVFGTVSEVNTVRSGGISSSTVTLDLRMVETQTGSTVWAVSHSEGRRGLFASLFGLSGKTTSETMRKCVERILKTLID
jgi:curli biogenesis system outer membrane secretion channel CsgG